MCGALLTVSTPQQMHSHSGKLRVRCGGHPPLPHQPTVPRFSCYFRVRGQEYRRSQPNAMGRYGARREVELRSSILRKLRKHGSATTLYRLLTSRHVADLRFIFSLTIISVVVGCAFALLIGVLESYESSSPEAVLWTRFVGTVAFIAQPCAALIALGFGISGWAYRSGSSRLGIVDLFACEISTLCRVCTIVDLTGRYVQAFDAGTTGEPDVIARLRLTLGHFEASEDYTPLFDQNAKELQTLNARVVTNVTAFYTYAKAMKDAMRNLGKIDIHAATSRADDAWHDAVTRIIYMQFLAFESARKAVRDLIEFEPNEVENTITILLSELRAYGFLLVQFEPKSKANQESIASEDFRHARLRLRHDSYIDVVRTAVWRAEEGKDYWTQREAKVRSRATNDAPGKVDIISDLARDWRRSAETAIELKNRCRVLFPDEPLDRPRDLPPPSPDYL